MPDKRTGWLASLAVGDTVIIESRWYGPKRSTIDAISKTGRMVADRIIFNPNGYIRGGSGWGDTHLVEATEARLAEARRIELVNLIRAWADGRTPKKSVRRASMEVLEAVAQLIEAPCKKPEDAQTPR